MESRRRQWLNWKGQRLDLALEGSGQVIALTLLLVLANSSEVRERDCLVLHRFQGECQRFWDLVLSRAFLSLGGVRARSLTGVTAIQGECCNF